MPPGVFAILELSDVSEPSRESNTPTTMAIIRSNRINRQISSRFLLFDGSLSTSPTVSPLSLDEEDMVRIIPSDAPRVAKPGVKPASVTTLSANAWVASLGEITSGWGWDWDGGKGCFWLNSSFLESFCFCSLSPKEGLGVSVLGSPFAVLVSSMGASTSTASSLLSLK